MRLQSDLIIFDVESNQPSGKIIEIGAVYFNRDFTSYTSEFQAYVNPDEEITPYIINLCSLVSDNLDKIAKSPPLQEVGNEFYKWATQKTSNIVLASWGNYDVTELHSQWPGCPFRKKSVDIKSIALWECARLGIKTENSLAASCAALKIPVITPIHRALPDAKTTANLLLDLAFRHVNLVNTVNHLFNGGRQ